MKLSKRNYIEIIVCLFLIVGWYFFYKKYFKEPIDKNEDKSNDFIMLMPKITNELIVIYILSNRLSLKDIKL